MENELRQKADEEKNRIVGILTEAGISKRRMQMLGPVIDNVSWMKAKLDDSRTLIKNSNIVVPYDNGGGQRGIRENPAFKGYESLWKAYMHGMNRILDTLPPEEIRTVVEDTRPQTLLDAMRAKYNAQL